MIRFSPPAVTLLMLACLGLQATAAPQTDVKLEITDPKLPGVVIVTTGGTIAEKSNSKAGGAVPALSGQALVGAVPELKQLANLGVCELCNIDSSQMNPKIWARLSRTVDEILARDDVTGVVVTHGTDTMAEGAYFLELTLKSSKPVVFTGAMKDASFPAPDGPGNLLNAVAQVCSPDAGGWGVTVTLNGFINSARAVRKTDTTNPQTFLSGDKGYLGYLVGQRVIRLNDLLIRQKLPLPEELPRVVFISTYAGADGDLVRHSVDTGAQGIVIEGVGAGNVNADTYGAILYAMKQGVVVVVSSRVYHGTVAPIYADAGGGKTLSDQGCILAGDLRGHKAILLLMLGLAEHGNDTEALKKLFEPR